MLAKPPRRFRSPIEPWQKTLFIAFFVQFTFVFGVAVVFPFLPLYVQDLGSTSSLSVELLSGLVYSGQSLTLMISSPIWGRIADRYGRKLMVQRAAFGGAVVLFAMGFATSAEMLILLRMAQGLVTGIQSAINALVAAAVPREKVGQSMGLIQVGFWGGIALGPLLGGILADAFGYRVPFFFTAGLLLIAGILTWLGIHENFKPQINERQDSILAGWQQILAASGIEIIFLLRFLASLSRFIILPIMPLFVVSLLPASARINLVTGLVTGASGAASSLASFYFGRLGDKLGHRSIFFFNSIAVGVFYLLQSQVVNVWHLFILQVLVGIAVGGTIISLTSLLANYSEAGKEGTVFGLDSSLMAGSRVLAPILGASLALWLNIRATMMVTGVLFLLIFLLAVWQLPKGREIGD